MSNKLAPYAFIISIMLVISSLFPSQASADSELSLLWEKEFDGHFYNEVAATSTNATLMTTYKVSENANYEWVYNFDFMKVDSAGNVMDTKNLKNGTTKIFEYNGQGYIAFFNKSKTVWNCIMKIFNCYTLKQFLLKGGTTASPSRAILLRLF